MKKISLAAIVAAFGLQPLYVLAQNEKQVSDTTGYNAIIPVQKQNLLKNMDVVANMQFNFRNDFQDGKFQESKFRMEQFRFEIKGNVTDKVYFRLRQRYTSELQPQSVDKITRATDLAFIRLDVSPKVSLAFGKMCADWGGWEFDFNPIDIYEYSDIVEYADNFLSGAQVSYRVNPKHEFTFQVLNSRTKSFEELYGDPPGKEESKVPLAIVGNWRGTLFGGKVTTLWSYSIFTEAKSTFMHYLALGTRVKLSKKFLLEYDYKLSGEGLDRTGVVSQTIPDSLYSYAVDNTLYSSHWLRGEYRVNRKWALTMIGMVDFARWNQDNVPRKTSNDIRTAWGFIPSVEYYPFDKLNLRFFVNYVGRVYSYSDLSKKELGAANYNTGRVCVGFITPLLIL